MSGAARGAALILVVDDNPMERFMARGALELAGFTVEEAETGSGGIELFDAHRPDVVLLDVKMPGMDGFSVCAALREHDAGAHVPVLMLTGLDDVDSIDRAYEAGATDFYVKPINCTILVHRVRYLLRAKRLADELRESRAESAYAQRMARLGYWRWDVRAASLEWSPEIESILGSAPGPCETLGAVFAQHLHPDDRDSVEAALYRVGEAGEAASIEHRIVRGDGGERVVHQEIEATRGVGGGLERISGTLQDITERRRTEAQIRHLAYHDTVTGLANRTLLREHLAYALAHARRNRRAVAVMFLDLDRFKRVNDTLGHSAGDDLLRQAGQRIGDSLRDGDRVSSLGRQAPEAATSAPATTRTVARIGGDEFVVLLGDVRAVEDAVVIARRIEHSLRTPFEVAGAEVYLSTSIGISGYPEDGDQPDELLKNADAAMYHAKARGRNQYQFFTAKMNERTLDRLSMEASLRRALEERQLLLHYQPIIGFGAQALTGVEALVRWQHPQRGLVPPGDFIPVAEETGLIVPLGEWVINEACVQMRRWAQSGRGHLSVSVNVSAAQFAERGFRDVVENALIRNGIGAGQLNLELTESMLMRDVDASAALLGELKTLGVGVAVDDFGTGYSSLAYLKRFPIDSLKIDRSFIRDIAHDPDDAGIVTATIALCRSLRLKVIAEGVEDHVQLAYLRDGGCDAFQGFLFARPMPVCELEAWLDDGEPARLLAGEQRGAVRAASG